MIRELSRREAMQAIGAAAAAATLGGAAPAAVVPPSRSRALRIAHLTDIHVEPEHRAGEGMAACLRHVRELDDKPDLIITGGDHVYDSSGADEARTRLQWELFTKIMRDGNAVPVLSCLGNHDCWGWNRKGSATSGSEPMWGKRWAMEALSMPGRYHSADRAGWHIVLLDSVQPAPKPDEGAYIGALDDEQFEWLAGDLAGVKAETPVLIVSHIPILAACPFFFGGRDRRGNEPSDWLMHVDAPRLKSLFLKHPNVKACVSGHIHLIDRVEYDGVTYLCNGAVCGNWWKGRHQECDEGYGLLDLYDDGTFERRYVTYGWKAEHVRSG